MKTNAYHPTTQPAAPFAPVRSPSDSLTWLSLRHNQFLKVSLWLGLHALLALVVANFNLAATAHSLVVVVVGLWYAINAKLNHVIYVCAYLVGAEVVWRMVMGMLFYEYGKYALSLILLVTILRLRLFRGPSLIIFYFVLLLPSIVMPSAFTDDVALRQLVSFNLSGPLALALSFWVLSQVKLTAQDMEPLLLALLGPIVTIGCMAAYLLATASEVYFGKSSNFAASGGFGPNQVSAVLGLGILVALLMALLLNYGRLLKTLMAVVIIGLAAQASLTFSRTGIYLAALSVMTVIPCLLSDAKTRLKLLGLAALLLLVGNFFVLPRLNAYTKGALTERFSNTDTTSRDTLFMADIYLWSENPFFGTGPGLGGQQRLNVSGDTAVTSHTEYSRLLAEHGLFGLAALATLLALCLNNLKRARLPRQRAMTWGFLCWASLYMLVSAMRLAAPAFLLGLTSVTWLLTPATHRSQE